jgi:hypothetical protein
MADKKNTIGHSEQLSVVRFGANAGPHNLVLSSNDNRLVVTDYFLNEDPRVPAASR